MSLIEAVLLTERMALIAVALQTLEHLLLPGPLRDDGVWRWSTVREEFTDFSPAFRRVLDASLSYPNVLILLWTRFAATQAALFSPSALIRAFALLTVLLTTILICLRFRGTYNGGSDYMTIIVIGALSLAAFVPSSGTLAAFALGYIAVQSCASYFLAGIAKVRNRSWRNGAALRRYMSAPGYGIPTPIRDVLSSGRNSVAASRAIIAVEVAFPFALIAPSTVWVFLAAGAAFHALNAYMLGLNRFFWIWLSTYPAILWTAEALR